MHYSTYFMKYYRKMAKKQKSKENMRARYNRQWYFMKTH